MLSGMLAALCTCLLTMPSLLRFPVLSRTAPDPADLAFPYVMVLPSEREITSNENACASENWNIIAYAQPPAVCVPPTGILHYAPALSGVFAINNTVATGLRPHCLADFFYNRWPVHDINKYLQVCFNAFDDAKTLLLLDDDGNGVPEDTKFDFPFHLLPGGSDGLVIFQRDIRSEWHGFTFDWRLHNPREPQPVHPYVETVDPQSRTDLNLANILNDARALAYDDLPFIEEICTSGFDNRSRLWTNIVLCAPYKGLFTARNFRFMYAKNQSKRSHEPRRMQGPFTCLPFLPCYMSPRNVCERPHDLKQRVTADFGAPRNLDKDGIPMQSPPANSPGPLSLNANLRMRNFQAFPDIDFLSVAALNKHVAVLGAVRAFCDGPVPAQLQVYKMKADFTAFYETLGRHGRCDNVQLQLVDTFVEYDERLIFGGADCPHECNRFAFFLTTALAARLQLAFDELDLDTLLTPDAKLTLDKWFVARGKGTACFALGEFFDDTGCFYFQFMDTMVRSVTKQFWADYNLEVVDGSDGRTSKLEYFDSATDMTFLGLDENTTTFVVSIGPEKRDAYAANAQELATGAFSSAHRRVRLSKVMRVEGQLNFCATAVPGLKGDLQCLRSVTRAGFALASARAAAHRMVPTTSLWTTLSVDGAERVTTLAARLRTTRGAAFYPRCRPFGTRGRTTLYIWTDASADYECDSKLYRGWGGMAMLWPLPIIFVAQDLITFNARTKLRDSTAFELFAANEMLAVMAPTLWTHPEADVCQVLDSSSAVDIINFCKPTSTFSRIFSQQRAQLRSLLPTGTQIVARHVRRALNEECDLLSKELLHEHGVRAKLDDYTAERFGASPGVVQLTPPPRARERVTVAVRAHDKKVFPNMGYTARAYVNATLRRSPANVDLEGGAAGLHAL